MSLPDYDIHSIRFEPDALVIGYQAAAGIRKHIVVSDQAILDRSHPDYGDDYEALLHKAQRVLVNALEDFHSSEPWAPDDDPDDDDDRGMGE